MSRRRRQPPPAAADSAEYLGPAPKGAGAKQSQESIEHVLALETDMQTPAKQGIVRDDRGQTQPADKERAQRSQMEGPAAYAPHEDEKKAPESEPAKKNRGHETA